ncbi:MAG: hypothetical protein JSR81_02250 [Proteobacteria bacterium]|nr:hypothetical protein [Pseudomonadota bacterium]
MNRWLARAKDWLTEFYRKSSPNSEDGIAPRWLAALVALWCVIDFAAFVVVSIFIGGDAINGYTKGGYYFVCMHGSCHEVTRAVFEYSRWHAISLFVSFPATFIVAWLAKQPRN